MGRLIFICSVVVLLAACGPGQALGPTLTPTASPSPLPTTTPSPTSTNTPTPTATSTITPTATPTPVSLSQEEMQSVVLSVDDLEGSFWRPSDHVYYEDNRITRDNLRFIGDKNLTEVAAIVSSLSGYHVGFLRSSGVAPLGLESWVIELPEQEVAAEFVVDFLNYSTYPAEEVTFPSLADSSIAVLSSGIVEFPNTTEVFWFDVAMARRNIVAGLSIQTCCGGFIDTDLDQLEQYALLIEERLDALIPAE